MNIDVMNYSKTIKDKTILNNINISFESGKVYGLYGRNGSGKTMFLRALCTLILPTSGDIKIDDVSILNNAFDLSQIGVLIENPHFFPYLTGYENLSLLYEMNHSKNQEHLLNMMGRFGLSEAANKKYKTYSLGMKQKLAICQAIMEDQKIILLDEPTNGLDEQSVLVFREVINQEKEKGKIIIIASHVKEDLAILCDHIYHIDSGEIEGEISL